MPPSLLILLILSLSAAAAAASVPPQYLSHFTRHRYRQPFPQPPPPQEYIEVVRPLDTDSLTPSCTLPVLSHSFGNTIGLPPVNATYAAPPNCTWSRAVVHLSGASNGSQYDRIAAVWIAGVEVIRTSTPEPTPDGIFWNVRKDVTKYSSLLRQSNISLAVMLENIVNDVYTGVYRVNLTFLYYDVASGGAVNSPLSTLRRNRNSTVRKMGENPKLINSLDLNENPADLIIPISSTGDEGFWFKLQSESDAVLQGIQIPLNTYRAVIEVYVSYHGDDEFWYTNPPDAYLELNKLPTSRGHGAYRQVVVKLDDSIVGVVVPFPVVFSGGINPLFWEPVVAIGAFDLPSYEVELTPFLAMLLNGNLHYFGLGVTDALPFWLVNANLHLWLDDQTERVEAGAIKHILPSISIEREARYGQLNGEFEVEGESESKLTGWVSYSAGNITMQVSRKVEYENDLEFEKNGTKMEVELEVKVKRGFHVMYSDTKVVIADTTVERKCPFKLKRKILPGVTDTTYIQKTKLKHSVEEEKQEWRAHRSNLAISQNSKGWILVQDKEVLSGDASTRTSYDEKDSLGCYRRSVSAENGNTISDVESFACERAAS